MASNAPIVTKTDPNFLVTRRVWTIPGIGPDEESSKSRVLSEFREAACWVLLGDPGAGKSTAMKLEADSVGGIYLRVDEFLKVPLDEPIGEKTLFLDGMDEARSLSNGNIITDIRGRLKEFSCGKFRIACRATDWFGSSDRVDLSKNLNDGVVQVLSLEKLSLDEITEILRVKYGVADPNAFIQAADSLGLRDLLDNPQSLDMLVNARRGETLPRSKIEAYRLACETLAEEVNPRTRDNQRETSPIPLKLEMTWKICAILLLSGCQGIALTKEGVGHGFAPLSALQLSDSHLVQAVLDSRLFRSDGENRLVPNHRSIAEYLGARWLATTVDEKRLPLGRLLNLLVGKDGRSVSGLRGLYGWLASLCVSAQPRLILGDPLTVMVSGDTWMLSPGQKRTLFQALMNEVQVDVGCVWDSHKSSSLGGLSCIELAPEFAEILKNRSRSDSSQEKAHVVVDILRHGEAHHGLGDLLLRVVKDQSRWQSVRTAALTAWIQLAGCPSEAKKLLAKLETQSRSEDQDEFVGILLRFLYPSHLEPGELLNHIHPAKQPSHLGMYRWFLEYELPKMAPDNHLQVLLDGLVGLTNGRPHDIEEYGFRNAYLEILTRGVRKHGETVDPERLFNWLGIGTDEHGFLHREKSINSDVSSWLESHPHVYKALVSVSLNKCHGAENPRYTFSRYGERFGGALPPKDLGKWLLEKAGDEQDKACARICLEEAVCYLWKDRGGEGLTLEDVLAWVGEDSERSEWVMPMLAREIQPWRIQHAKQSHKFKVEEQKRKREFSEAIIPHLENIHAGRAVPGWHDRVAKIWKGWYVQAKGDSSEERFDHFFGDGNAIRFASESGFRNCISRDDIPSHLKIIKLHLHKKQHYLLQYPCLLGMELLESETPDHLLAQDDERLQSMVAFALVDQMERPEWLTRLAINKPNLVSKVILDYANAIWKKKNDDLSFVDWVCSDKAPVELKEQVLPLLMEKYPRQDEGQTLRNLEGIIRAGIGSIPERTKAIAETKLRPSKKPMDPSQKALWMSSLVILAPNKFDPHPLWEHVQGTPELIQLAVSFLLSMGCKQGEPSTLEPGVLGQMAKMLAPHADVAFHSGVSSYTQDRARGDLLRSTISTLAKIPTPEANQALEELLALPELAKVRYQTLGAKRTQVSEMREEAFAFPLPGSVAATLSNGAPSNARDLAFLLGDHLDEIGRDFKATNEDGFRAFWNVGTSGQRSMREENLCRDILLMHLGYRLSVNQIRCDPEGDYFNDKRADIRASYQSQIAIPIEVKRHKHPEVWTAIHGQLLRQYSIDPASKGFGIFLVIWFGIDQAKPDPTDRKRPVSAMDMKERLEKQLTAEEAERILIKVIDVSWPEPPSKPTSGKRNKRSSKAKRNGEGLVKASAKTRKKPKASKSRRKPSV